MKKLLYIIIIGILFTGGVNAEPRKIDGKLLETKDYWRFVDYTIQTISNKGITIIYKNVFAERRTTVKPQNWPDKLRDQVAKRIYVDSKGKIYDISLCAKRKDRLYKNGDYFFITGTPVKSGRKTKIKNSINSFVISNDNSIEHGSYQELPVLVIGETSKRNYTVELLFLPTKEQLKAYFRGKPIKPLEQ
ncbi:MAG: hypothetical protein KAS17_05355 [Victivallaceae bacterium]|nr:hypothetical protein [Victivallaceae bacterium]